MKTDPQIAHTMTKPPLEPAPAVKDAPPVTNPTVELNHPELREPRIPPTPLSDEEMEPSLLRQIRHLLSQYVKQGLRVTLLEAGEQLYRRFIGLPMARYSVLSEDVHVGGQYNERGWKILRDQRGIDAVVNMRAEFDESAHGFGPDAEHYCHLPTPDGYPPTLENVQKGVAFIRDQVAKGNRVYVHCWEGVGRAPTVVAAYLVSTGLTPAEAWGKLKALRPFIRPSAAQLYIVDAFAYQWAQQPPLTAQLEPTPIQSPEPAPGS